MRLPVFSFVAISIFACSLVSGNYTSEEISRETSLRDYRTAFHIEPKTSVDGVFTTRLCEHTPVLVGKVWVPNHARSLRALLAEDVRTNERLIYIEQAQPRMCYELHGSNVLQNADEVYWMSPTTIAVITNASSTEPVEYLIDVRTLSSSHHPFLHDEHLHQKQVGAFYVD